VAPTWSAFLKYKLETAVERGGPGGAVLDTLLGPEGSDDTRRARLIRVLGVCGLVFLVVGLTDRLAVAGWGVGCRLYFENFTVDASIFVVSSF
jgi:hypothetical protein